MTSTTWCNLARTINSILLKFAMTQSAMAQLETRQSLVQCLVLAYLASVVILGQDALTRGYARREVTAALSATRIIVRNDCIAVRLWTLDLILVRVYRRMSRE
jgi:hypothetical protein